MGAALLGVFFLATITVLASYLSTAIQGIIGLGVVMLVLYFIYMVIRAAHKSL